MNETLTAFLYLVASICFIMALRGLSSPETSRGGQLYGIVGMAIAIAHDAGTADRADRYWLIIAGIIVGGAVGTLIAQQIQMTALPQLVAAFHSLVGLAAVAWPPRRFYAPAGLRHRRPRRDPCRQPGRDGPRHGDRRHHLHRLDRRLRQAAGAGVRRAAGVPGPAPPQCALGLGIIALIVAVSSTAVADRRSGSWWRSRCCSASC